MTVRGLRPLLSLPLALAALPGAAGGQEPAPADTAGGPGPAPADSAIEVEAVVVSVTRDLVALDRVPFAVSVVAADETLASERRRSLAELLHTVPGVQVFDRRNEALGDRIVLRGVGARAQFGVRGVQVIADGVPLTLPDGQATLTNLDLGAAERVEVLRGPAAALYGNAAGGVIRVRSGGFTGGPLRLRPRVTLGTAGFRREEVGATARTAGVDWALHLSHMETDGFRDHASAEVWRANLVARGELASGEVRAVVNLYDTPFAENPSSLDFEDARNAPRSVRPLVVEQGLGEEARQLQAGVSATLPLGDGPSLDAAVWGLARELWNPIPFRIIAIDRAAGGLRARLSGALDAADAGWSVGLDVGLQRDDRRERENLGVGEGGVRAREGTLLLDQDEEVAYLAPFLRLEAEPLPGVSLTGALRLDAYRFAAEDALLVDGDDSGRRRLSRLSPAVGLAWKPGEAVTLYANLSTAFETPTLSELSNRPDGRGGLDPDLAPERLVSREAGVRARLPGTRLVAEAAVYDASVVDALVPFEGPEEQVFFRNAGEVARTGVEISLAWRPLGWLEATSSYAYQDHRFERFSTAGSPLAGRRVPGVPVHRLHAELAAGGERGPTGSVRLGWSDAYPVNDENTAFEPSHRVVDVRGAWAARADGWRLRPFLAVDNLFDERYDASVVPNAFGGRYYEPAPGRQLFGGIEVGLPGP